MHSHLITFTGPITTTYSQIAPNLLPSPDCSPEPKVGNTTSCTTTQIYPWGIAGFPAEPTPSRVPRAVSRAPPPPPPQLQKPEARTFPPESLVGQVGHFQVLFPQAPSTILVAQPQPSFLGVLHAGFPGSLGRLGRGRGGVFLQRSPPIALTPASAALCCCRTQTPQRGLAEPSPSLHLAFIASPAPSSLSTSPGTLPHPLTLQLHTPSVRPPTDNLPAGLIFTLPTPGMLQVTPKASTWRPCFFLPCNPSCVTLQHPGTPSAFCSPVCPACRKTTLQRTGGHIRLSTTLSLAQSPGPGIWEIHGKRFLHKDMSVL